MKKENEKKKNVTRTLVYHIILPTFICIAELLVALKRRSVITVLFLIISVSCVFQMSVQFANK